MEVLASSSSRFTESGHLVGMLDRDQRTTSTSTKPSDKSSSRFSYDDENDFVYEPRLISDQISAKDKTSSRRYGWSMQRLKQALVVVVHLLIVVPNVLSAPSGSKMGDNVKMNMREIYDQAIMNHNRADDKFEAYTENLFNLSSTEAYERYKNSTEFRNLPSEVDIPKEYKSDIVNFSNRTMNEELVHLHSQFNKIRIAMEHVLKDENHCHTNGKNQTFCENFMSMHADLKNFVTQLEVAIENLKLEKAEPETTEAEDTLDGEGDEAWRRRRNWTVYRVYINALEYTRLVLERFNKF